MGVPAALERTLAHNGPAMVEILTDPELIEQISPVALSADS